MAHPLIPNPAVGMLAEAVALSALILALRICQRRFTLSAEASRKLFHIGGGLTTLAFPWLFTSAWPVLALAPLTIGALLALKYVRRLRGELGAVLYGIERSSRGEVYMPASITLVWLLSHGDPMRYCVPVLILTLADPAAALVGVRIGRRRFATVEGHKSIEGSLTFLCVAWLCAALPLLLVTPMVHPTTSILIALDVALVTTVAEAIAWRGLDNLVIPPLAFALLAALPALPFAALVAQLLAAGCLVAGALRWRYIAPSLTAPNGARWSVRLTRMRAGMATRHL